MKFKRFPTGLVIPARPVVASRPPSGPDWVHEIKHDGYRLIVRRDGPTVRPYSRNAYDGRRLEGDRGFDHCVIARSRAPDLQSADAEPIQGFLAGVAGSVSGARCHKYRPSSAQSANLT